MADFNPDSAAAGKAQAAADAQSETGYRTGLARSAPALHESGGPLAPGLQIPGSPGPGTVIRERFVLEERIGSGGMGVVFRARDLRREEAKGRDSLIAIKFLGDEFRRHPDSLRALRLEATRAQSLAHPNIVTVHDFDRDGELIYMTMEYLQGEPLDRVIRDRGVAGASFGQAWPIIRGAGQALAYAHEQGIVHCDFKPSNVFVLSNGRVKVLDFGIARAMRVAAGGASQTVFDAGSLGALTPTYASPEMFLGLEPDPRDDVYALACVTHELLSGQHPFRKVPSPQAMHRKLLPEKIDGISRRQFNAIRRGLAFVREDRTGSVQRFLDELQPQPGRAHRRAIAATSIAVAAAAAVSLTLFVLGPGQDDAAVLSAILDQARAAAPRDMEVDAQMRDFLLDQGRDYLAQARTDFQPALLSEGVSTASGAFRAALTKDPSSQAAAMGILDVVRAYEQESGRALQAGDGRRALELAEYGLKVVPDYRPLQKNRNKALALTSR